MITHAERRLLGYRPEQMFDLVADVERYPEFLPWCIGARIRERKLNLLVADLIIGFRMIRERFTSRVVLDKPRLRVVVEYIDGPFSHMENIWTFRHDQDAARSLVTFFIDYEFRSRFLGSMMGSMFDAAFHKFSEAFEKRADGIYK